MERTISENVKMSFGVIAEGSNDELAIKALAVDPDIWEEQCGDLETKDQIEKGSFAGVTAAVFRIGTVTVGYILFVARQDGLYEQHTAFIGSVRTLALKCIQAALEDLFLTTPCIGVLTLCPDWNLGSRHLAQKIGGIMVSKILKFKVREGRMQGATLYHLPIWNWCCEHHDEFEAAGEAWHDKVFSQMPEAEHDDDSSHNAWLGLALEMGKMQPQKASDIYNSWAGKAGYAPAKLLWADGQGSALIDIFSAAVLNTRDGNAVVVQRCPTNPQGESSHSPKDSSPS